MKTNKMKTQLSVIENPKDFLRTEIKTIAGIDIYEFDEIKNFLDIRPIGHYEERRVKAHTFVCVLSFLVECLIERFSSESARKTIRRLQRIRKIDLVSKKHEKQILTEIEKETEEIFKSLKILKPRI